MRKNCGCCSKKKQELNMIKLLIPLLKKERYFCKDCIKIELGINRNIFIHEKEIEIRVKYKDTTPGSKTK